MYEKATVCHKNLKKEKVRPMKKSKKLLSLALALVMTLSLAAPAMAADETKTETGKIVILHTNDVH